MIRSSARISVVGFGAIAEKHLEVFRDLGADVSGSCNRSEAGRARAREVGGIERTYADAVQMVEREKPDGLLVTVSVSALAETARRLIPLGVPILLEKPPGLSYAEAVELSSLAAKHQTRVMVGLNRRFYSVYLRAIDSIGGRQAITGVHVEWSEDPERMAESGHPEAVVSRLNFANSLHGIDLLPFFGGHDIQGQAWGRALAGGKYRWQMAFDGKSGIGARLQFASNWDVPGRWRVIVDAHDYRMVSAPLETATILRRGKPPLEITPSEEDQRFKPGFHGQANAFLHWLRTQQPPQWPVCTLAGAIPSMQIAEMLTEMCKSG